MAVENDLLEGKVKRLLQEAVYNRREEQWSHIPYSNELSVLRNIKKGNVEAVVKGLGIFRPHKGNMSDDPYRQSMYEFVATATLVTRFAVEGGLDSETAYSISDAYIKTADTMKTAEEIKPLYLKMITDFTRRVRQVREKKPRYSPTILQCVDYIDKNLHYRITLDNLAEVTGRNAVYLCSQFKQETGMPITEYINRAKVNEAKELLTANCVSIAEVASVMGFCSQSYFSKVFKELTGETPRQYQREAYSTHEVSCSE